MEELPNHILYGHRDICGPVKRSLVLQRAVLTTQSGQPHRSGSHIWLTVNTASLVQVDIQPIIKWHNAKPTAYVDALMDEFLCLDQGPAHKRRHVWLTLFRALDKVF